MPSSLKIPDWIKVQDFNRTDYAKTLGKLKGVNTVCMSANCPNRYECFANSTATFMILGDTCTRNCKYCAVKSGLPNLIDLSEPKKIAKIAKDLNLKYVVITCVSRDDLKDGGASVFIETVREIRKLLPKIKIELLISDLNGNWDALNQIIKENPYVLNHNIEVVRSLFPTLRPKGDYLRSLELLKKCKIVSKSGLMVGLGETEVEIMETLQDLRNVHVDIITIGQYLQPSKDHAQVKKYYTPNEFKVLAKKAKTLGFKKVFTGPLVRSSYHAQKVAK